MKRIPRILAIVLSVALIATSFPFVPVGGIKTAEAAESETAQNESEYVYEKIGSYTFDKSAAPTTEAPAETSEEVTPDTSEEDAPDTSEEDAPDTSEEEVPDTSEEENPSETPATGNAPLAKVSKLTANAPAAEGTDGDSDDPIAAEDDQDAEESDTATDEDGYDYYVRYKKKAYLGAGVTLEFVRTGLGKDPLDSETKVTPLKLGEDIPEESYYGSYNKYYDTPDISLTEKNRYGLAGNEDNPDSISSTENQGLKASFKYYDFARYRYQTSDYDDNGNWRTDIIKNGFSAPSNSDTFKVTIGEFGVQGSYYDKYGKDNYGYPDTDKTFTSSIESKTITLDLDWVSPITFTESTKNLSNHVVGNATSNAQIYKPVRTVASDYSEYYSSHADDFNITDQWEKQVDTNYGLSWSAAPYYEIFDDDLYVPSSSGIYRCYTNVTVNENGESLPVVTNTSAEYEATLVKSSPVLFSNGNGKFINEARRTVYVKNARSGVDLKPEALVSEGYDVTYQWSLQNIEEDGEGGEFVDIPKADSENYTAKNIDFTYTDGDGEKLTKDHRVYKVTASATFKGEKDVVYTATSTFTLTSKPYVYKSHPENWDAYAADDYYTQAAVGDTVTGTLPIEPADGSGYKLTYQWYQVDPEYVYNSYDVEYAIRHEDEDGAGAGYTRLSRETSAALSHKMVSKDFDYTDDGGRYHHVSARFICKVTAENKTDGKTETDLFTMNVSEDYNLTKLYDENESVNRYITADAGEKVSITATKYSVNKGYKVSYQWSKFDHYDYEDGTYEPVYVDIPDSNKTAKTRTLEVTAPASGSSDSYRCTISVTRNNEKQAINEDSEDSDDYTRDYTVYGDSNVKLDVSSVTSTHQTVKLGGSANFGVKAEVNDKSYTVSYRWTLNGKDLDNAKDTYKVDNCRLTDFGEYRCTVTATGSGQYLPPQVVTFVLDEDTGLKLVSPSNTRIDNKTAGDQVELNVEAESDDDKATLTYRWYKSNTDELKATNDSYNLIEGETKSSLKLKLTSDDFTRYKVIVSDSHSTVEATYDIVDGSYGAYAEVAGTENKYAGYDKKLDDPLTLKVDAGSIRGDVNFTYKWFKYIDKYYYGDSYRRLIDDADASEYTLNGGDKAEYGRYEVEVTGTDKDGNNVYSTTIQFNVNLLDTSEQDIFTEVDEYGKGAYNRVGDKVSFGVKQTAGDGKYTYKWTFARTYNYNGIDYTDTTHPEILKDETDGIISINSLTEDDFGYYTLTVIDQDGNIKVGPYPYTLTEYKPSGLTAEARNGITTFKRAPGQDVTLEVEAESAAGRKLTYQWYSGSVYDRDSERYVPAAIYGETGSKLEFKNLQRADFGTYTCRVTDGELTEDVTFTITRTANLKIDDDLLDSDEIRTVSKKIGEKATFTVKATSDKNSPITYTWHKGSEYGGRIDGAAGSGFTIESSSTASSLTVDKVRHSDLGYYYVTIDNGVDEPETRGFNLVLAGDYYLRFIDDDDDEDDIDDGISKDVYDGGNMDIDVTTTEGSKVTVNAAAEASDGYTPYYQWQKFDTVQNRWVDIDKATSADYTIDKVDFADRYRCVAGDEASEPDNNQGFIYATVYLTDKEARGTSLTITAGGENTDYAIEGQPVTFTAEIQNPAAGAEYSYQWYGKDADGNLAKIPGATGSTYTVTAPAIEDDEYYTILTTRLTYWCKVTTGEADDEISRTASGYIDELNVPASATANPASDIYEGASIQKYVPAAGTASTRIVFDKAYSLKGYGSLQIINGNGEIVYDYPSDSDYEDSDYEDLAGQDIEVTGSPLYFFFEPYDDDESVDTRTLTRSLENGTSKFGYRVARIGAKAALDQEDADAQKKAAEEEAKAAADAKAAEEAQAAAAANQKKVNDYVNGLIGVTTTDNQKKINDYVADLMKATKDAEKKGNGDDTSLTIGNVVVNGTVANKAKKIKAAKKKVKAKKGKTFKITLKVTAENNKKAVTDSVKVTKLKGRAKLTGTKIKKGKIVLTFKAQKAGKANLKIKVGSASAKVKLTVKK